MCDIYEPFVDFSRTSTVDQLIKGSLNGLNTSLLTDYIISLWFAFVPLLFVVLLMFTLFFCCCCYSKLKRPPRNWFYYFLFSGLVIVIMVSSIFLNLHLDNPSCHFEETRVVSKTLLTKLIAPADTVLLSFDKTINDVQQSMIQAEADRGGSLLKIKQDYTDALDVLENAAKAVDCSTNNCSKCLVCANQDPLRAVSNEIKAIPVDDIQNNIESVDELLIDASTSVKDGVKGIKDTLADVVDFIDDEWYDHSTQFTSWSEVAQSNSWILWTPYILILFSTMLVGLSVYLKRSTMGCIGWCSMWCFLILMCFLSSILLLISLVGTDVCVVLDQSVTEYAKLDNRSMDMIQSCINDENVVPKDLVDNYEFTNVNFNATMDIEYTGLTNASTILYDGITDFIVAEKNDAKAKELLFLLATKITHQNIIDIENSTSELLDFGNDIVGDFRCTLLNKQYTYMQKSICYLTSTLFLYSLLFFGVCLLSIPLLIASINLVLSLREYDKIEPV